MSGVTIGRVCRIDATTGVLDVNFQPGIDGNWVRSLLLSGDNLYAGGLFDVTGHPIQNLANIDVSTGEVDVSFTPNPDDAGVYSMVKIDNRLFVGGFFNVIDGQSSANLVKLDATTGSIYADFYPSAVSNKTILSLFLSGGKLYTGTYLSSFFKGYTNIIYPDVHITQGGSNVSSYDFGTNDIGESSTGVTIVIENRGDADLILTGTPKINAYAGNTGDFTIDQSALVSPVAPGNSTSFTAVFNPSLAANRTVWLSIANNDQNKTLVLRGFGNNIPVFTSTGSTSIDEDISYTYNITTNDMDSWDALTITIPTKPTWLSLTDNGDGTAILTGTPSNDDVGIHNVVLRVDDNNGGTTNQTFTIVVNNINDAPVVTSYGGVTSVDEDNPLTINLNDFTVTDVDNIFPTGFDLTLQPGANYSVSGSTITPSTNYNGTLTVPAIINDGTDNSLPYNITVTVDAIPLLCSTVGLCASFSLYMYGP